MVSELAVAVACLERGWQVLTPLGVARYDLVIERAGVFFRVQVKTAKVRNGCVVFAGYSIPGGQVRRSYGSDEVDYMAAHCPENGEVYVVPISEARLEYRLRLIPTANNQAAGVKWAKDYLLSISL